MHDLYRFLIQLTLNNIYNYNYSYDDSHNYYIYDDSHILYIYIYIYRVMYLPIHTALLVRSTTTESL